MANRSRSQWGDDERADIGREARRTPGRGVPEAIPDEVTGNFDGEALREIRGRRPTPERVQRLEEKHDTLLAKLDEHGQRIGRVEVAVAAVGGKMEILPRLVESLQDATKAMQQREHVTLTAQVQVDTANKVDAIDKKKAKREFGWKFLAAAVPALLGSWEVIKALLHHWGVL